MIFRVVLICIMPLILGFAVEAVHVQARKPTPNETAAIRTCAAKTADNPDQVERQCLFVLVTDPCVKKGPDNTQSQVGCNETETAIWDTLLNENYKSLLDTLDSDQTAKAQAMQRAWIAYRDTTCGFYDDKIQGTMSLTMHAACVTRETARRAVLLRFFGRL